MTTSSSLIRPVFFNPRDGQERRGYRSHLKDSTNKPLCAVRQRGFGVGEGTAAARWIEVDGCEPTCPICQRIAKRMEGAA